MYFCTHSHDFLSALGLWNSQRPNECIRIPRSMISDCPLSRARRSLSRYCFVPISITIPPRPLALIRSSPSVSPPSSSRSVLMDLSSGPQLRAGSAHCVPLLCNAKGYTPPFSAHLTYTPVSYRPKLLFPSESVYLPLAVALL